MATHAVAGPAHWERLTLPVSSSERIEARLYRAPEAHAAVLCVGGVGGGFDTPSVGLYERLGEFLPPSGVALLRVRYRNPTDLEGAVQDVRAGVRFLTEDLGLSRIALVGHSFGGAVVIRAAVSEPAVTSVVTLAAQAYGTADAKELGRPVLLLHGTEDDILPDACSIDLARRIGGLARLRLHEGAGHGLDEFPNEVLSQVESFLMETLL